MENPPIRMGCVTMTPEEARELIETAKRISPRLDHDLPHLVDGKDIADMTETIAAMHYEYAVQARIQENGQWHQVTEWSTNPNPYKPGHKPHKDERIVRRLVGPTEEA